jgi:hypothetical protein
MVLARITLIAAAGLMAAGEANPPPRPAAGNEDRTSQLITDGLKLLDEGAYLKGIESLEAAALSSGEPSAGPAYQTWIQMRPMIGSYAPPPQLRASEVAPVSEDSAARLRRATPRDAVAVIAAGAARTQIVILNEAHHSPRDRAFALEVARALRPLGYTILGVEALVNRPATTTRLASEGFPRLGSGTYVREPVFGDFLRQALALGYTPVAYEEAGEQRSRGKPDIAQREQAQAENLAAAIRAHPGRKMLIYAGFSHVAEAPIEHGDGKMDWMASRLKKMTGIDPLTVDQTSLAEDSMSRGGRGAWALAAPKLRRSSVMWVDGRWLVLGPYAGAVDLQVLHPPVRLRGDRPDWLAMLGRRPHAVPRRLLPGRGRRLVQAFLANEPEDAVPIDQVVVEPGKPPPKMMLPKARIRYAVQDSGFTPAP